MDKTNYPVLSLVAVIAVVAIVAIFLDARAGSGIMPLNQGIALIGNAIFNVPITGQVIAGNTKVHNELPATSTYDMNSDGTLNKDDATILGIVIDRMRFCPANKICDIDGDGVVDLQDLGLLNVKILSTPQVSPRAPVAPVQKQDSAEQVGSFGAIV